MTTASARPDQASQRPFGSETVTRGFRVRVTPTYIGDRSEPRVGHWLFGYRIRITNESDRTAELISRRWSIVDADGDMSEVAGDGVVGNQPVLGPGENFEYTSSCPLQTPWGTMEGTYQMKGDDGEMFDVRVGRFYLVSPEARPS